MNVTIELTERSVYRARCDQNPAHEADFDLGRPPTQVEIAEALRARGCNYAALLPQAEEPEPAAEDEDITESEPKTEPARPRRARSE